MAIGDAPPSSEQDDFVNLTLKRPCLRDPLPKLKDGEAIEEYEGAEEEIDVHEENEDEDDVQLWPHLDNSYINASREQRDVRSVSSRGLHPGFIVLCLLSVAICSANDALIAGSRTPIALSVLNVMLQRSAVMYEFCLRRS